MSEPFSRIRLSSVLRRAVCLLLVLPLILMTACSAGSKTVTPTEFLLNITDLVVDDFGVVSGSSLDPVTTVAEITDLLILTLLADSVTGNLRQSELALHFDNDLEKLDYSSFEYFFLILLKAYDPDITITNINTIHDTLGIGTYEPGTNAQIGYGSNIYFYTVTDSMALFTAQYLIPSETLEN